VWISNGTGFLLDWHETLEWKPCLIEVGKIKVADKHDDSRRQTFAILYQERQNEQSK
jgi:hypothetical protein